MPSEMRFRSTVSKLVRHGFNLVGVWPGISFPELRKFLCLTFSFVPTFYQYTYVINNFSSKGLKELFDCFAIFISYVLLIIKFVVMIANSGVVFDVLSSMEEDYVKYSVADAKSLISKATNLSHTITGTVVTLYVSTSVYFIVSTLASSQSNNTESRNLILHMDLPFETADSPNYELTLAFQFVSMIWTAYAYSILTAFLLELVLHMGCHLDILRLAMTNIVSAEDEKQFRFVAVRHQELILFSEQIEQIYTFVCLAQLMSNTMVSCCLGYLVVVEGLQEETDYLELMKFLICYITICVEVFIYCFAGEYLNIKNDTIVEAAYQISWYNLQPSTIRQVIFLLLRSQKGMQLTFGKFSALNLDTFTLIMKTSASYMSVFLAMS